MTECFGPVIPKLRERGKNNFGFCAAKKLAPLSPQIRTRTISQLIQLTPNLWGEGLGVRGKGIDENGLNWISFFEQRIHCKR
jgi:hypothetical protein